jgi:RHS repeat-associated protein
MAALLLATPPAWAATPLSSNLILQERSQQAPSDPAPGDAPALLSASPGVSALAGRVLQTDGIPLRGVVLRYGHALALTDASGRFLLENIKPGQNILQIDGRGAIAGNRHAVIDHGIYEVRVATQDGVTTQLNWVSWLPVIDHAHDVTMASPARQDEIAKVPAVPGLELHIPKGAVLTDLDGQAVTQFGLTPIPVNRPPYPLPRGVDVPVYFTAQPGGAVISSHDGSWIGAQIVYPNYHHDLPGARGTFWRYQPDSNGWSPYGTGHVSSDGTQMVPEAGTRIYALEGAMFGTCPPPAAGPVPSASSPTILPPGPQPGDQASGTGSGGDPVDLSSGLFVHSQTDLTIADVLPIQLTRTYRPADANHRMFGTGMTSQWDSLLWTDNSYQTFYLVGPDGSRVTYARVPDPLNPSDNSPQTAHFSSNSPGPWYGSVIDPDNVMGFNWRVTRRDGLMLFYDSGWLLHVIEDRFGNRITLTRNGKFIYQITSPNGRFIIFTYDSHGDALTATDNIGRSIAYTYDPSTLNLLSVVGPDMCGTSACTTQYGWNASNQMASITDARGPTSTFLQNTYDGSSRLLTQTIGSGALWQFAYTSSGGGTETDVTDPNSNKRNVTFNSAGYMLTDKHAFGTPIEQDWTYTYGTTAPTANLVASLLDPYGRQTNWTNDASGNVLSVTRTAGGTNATAAYTYSPAYNQLASVTDPNSNQTLLNRGALDTLTSIVDPLLHTTSFTYNPNGQVSSAKDALNNSYNFAYDTGDLISVTDPLSQATVFYEDAIGRRIRGTNPAGNQTRWVLDAVNGVLTATDGNQNTTTIAYTPIGQIQSVTDAQGHAISYTYGLKALPTGRIDAVGASSSANWDAIGNLLNTTDRNGHFTSYTHDALNRITGATYADSSTTSWTYTAAPPNTTITITDSLGGTITRTYDGFNRLISEATPPRGTVTYTYDLAGRRTAMSATGANTVTYAYDAANRLTGLTQGTKNITLGYDNANRRTAATLPGGVTAAYSYDNDSNLTGITYGNGSSTIGTLTYSYDPANRVSGVGGTLYQTNLHNAITASYNNANRITALNGTAFAWDANGNVTSDGTNSYGWNARNQLTAVGSTAAYAYDALGRRITSTVSGVSTSYLYDGWDVVEEQQGGSLSAAMLTGLATDERFSRSAGGVLSTYLVDRLGSTMALAGGSPATVLTSYGYNANGAATVSGAATTSSYTFTGRESDATGLIAMRNRYYKPNWGRFISEDPIDVAGGVNLYQYANNNPTTFRDPYGNAAWGAALGGYAGGVLAGTVGVETGPLDAAIAMAGRQIGRAIGDAASDAIDNAIAAAMASSEPASTATPSSSPANSCNSSDANGNNLGKDLGSQQQMGEPGQPIAGAGSDTTLRAAVRLSDQYGGDPGDWSKMTSSSYTAPDGTQFQTHWYENIQNGLRVEMKTVFPH